MIDKEPNFTNEQDEDSNEKVGTIPSNLGVGALKKEVEVVTSDVERQEKLKKGVKIVIGGPPHSGKSVFIEALMANLDKDHTFSYSAAPDGEGPWLQRHYDNPDVVQWRQKGSLTPEFVEHSRDVIQNWDGPLMLVDVGGRTSPENAQMIKGATHAIILAGDLSKVDEWHEFFDGLSIEVIAKLHSWYAHDKDKNVTFGKDIHFEGAENGQVVGSVHYLERGEPAGDRDTIQAVAAHIESLVANNVSYNEAHEVDEESHFIVDLPSWTVDIPNKTIERTLNLCNADGEPYQKVVQNRQILRSAIPVLYEKIKADFDDGRPVWLNGPINSWEAIALALGFAEAGSQEIRLRGPDGYIPIEKLEQSTEVVTDSWSVEQQGELNGQPIYFIHEKTNRNNPFNPKNLPDYKIPEVPEGCVVVISTQGPNWLRASIALGYKDHVSAIAAFQPGEGSTIAWSADKRLLGEVLDKSGEILHA